MSATPSFIRSARVAPVLSLAAGLLLGLGVAGRGDAQDKLPAGSPFMPTGGAAMAANAPGEMIEFAAVRTIGKKTEIDLYDTQGKKNHWIPLGGSAEGMSVLTYDSVREQVVAKIGGVEKVLSLRKSRNVAGAPIVMAPNPAMNFNVPTQPQPPPAPPPAPSPVSSVVAAAPTPEAQNPAPAPAAATPAQPTQPLSVARQEEEARMLVSDLLEIGMAQRKAYEDKQRAAQNPNGAAPAATTTPAAPAPTPTVPPSGT